jgi:hypothetical protein
VRLACSGGLQSAPLALAPLLPSSVAVPFGAPWLALPSFRHAAAKARSAACRCCCHRRSAGHAATKKQRQVSACGSSLLAAVSGPLPRPPGAAPFAASLRASLPRGGFPLKTGQARSTAASPSRLSPGRVQEKVFGARVRRVPVRPRQSTSGTGAHGPGRKGRRRRKVAQGYAARAAAASRRAQRQRHSFAGLSRGSAQRRSAAAAFRTAPPGTTEVSPHDTARSHPVVVEFPRRTVRPSPLTGLVDVGGRRHRPRGNTGRGHPTCSAAPRVPPRPVHRTPQSCCASSFTFGCAPTVPPARAPPARQTSPGPPPPPVPPRLLPERKLEAGRKRRPQLRARCHRDAPLANRWTSGTPENALMDPHGENRNEAPTVERRP